MDPASPHTTAGLNLGTGAAQATPPPTIRVLFVLLPHSLTLDWAGPAEALRSANHVLQRMGLPPRFELGFVGPQADPITSVGVRLSGIAPLPDLGNLGTAHDGPGTTTPSAQQPTWVVLVGEPGDAMPLHSPATQHTLHWLRGLRLVPGQLELLTVCAGAVLAAHAGLLSGREATTHHHHLSELQAADATCRVQSNRVFVTDGPVYSSAGVTTGIDLVLHRMASVCGPVVAAQVAQALVVGLRRGQHDPELSPFLSHRHHLHAAVHRVQDAVSQAPRADWTAKRMADVACTSARHLARLFTTHAGIAPLPYLRGIRLAVAQAALRSGLGVGQAADMAGFSSDLQLRRAWHQAGLAGTPSGAQG